ncbi:hypothetical protein BGZ63DRAFT_145612 [Mariannaea sp. PMI_226]|nr:hypothetical protein BGZ63DRAFT_145612 [Mariannaea sp. PMI_226]
MHLKHNTHRHRTRKRCSGWVTQKRWNFPMVSNQVTPPPSPFRFYSQHGRVQSDRLQLRDLVFLLQLQQDLSSACRVRFFRIPVWLPPPLLAAPMLSSFYFLIRKEKKQDVCAAAMFCNAINAICVLMMCFQPFQATRKQYAKPTAPAPSPCIQKNNKRQLISPMTTFTDSQVDACLSCNPES